MSEEAFTITYDGQPLPVVAGQTVAAALIASGHIGWRQTREHRSPRGLFCGIGVCFDCLITLNGTRSVRACLVSAEPGDVVSSQQGVERDDILV